MRCVPALLLLALPLLLADALPTAADSVTKRNNDAGMGLAPWYRVPAYRGHARRSRAERPARVRRTRPPPSVEQTQP